MGNQHGSLPTHAIFMKLCALIVLVMTAIIMVYSHVNSIPLANYDVIYDVTTIAKSTPL